MGRGTPKSTLTERDLSYGVSGNPSEPKALVMGAEYGPANTLVSVNKVNDIKAIFGKPVIGKNEKTWMTAYRNLQYGADLYLVRGVKDDYTSSNANKFILAPSKTFLQVVISAVSGAFTIGETVTGGTSSATGTVVSVTATIMVVELLTGNFEFGETITGGTSSETATANSFLYYDDHKTYIENWNDFNYATCELIVTTASITAESGDTITQDVSGATGDIISISDIVDTANSLIVVNMGDTSVIFDATNNITTVGTPSQVNEPVIRWMNEDDVAIANHFSDNQVSMVYADYVGSLGNSIQFAYCSLNEYYKEKTYDGTNTFKSLFSSNPNPDLRYREEVISVITDASVAPPSENIGDRYLINGGASIHADWDGAEGIVEFDGTNWVSQTIALYDFTYSIKDRRYYKKTSVTPATEFNLENWEVFSSQFVVVAIDFNDYMEKFIVSSDENDFADNGESLFIDDYLEENSIIIKSRSRSRTSGIDIEFIYGYSPLVYLSNGKSEAPSLAELQGCVDVIFADEKTDIRLIGDNHDFNTNEDIQSLQNYISGKLGTAKSKFGVYTLPSDVINTNLVSDSMAVADAVTYIEGMTVESRCAIGDNWIRTYDPYNHKRYYVPFTGDYMGIISRTAIDVGLEKAPYGSRDNKGILISASKLLHLTTEGMRNILYDNRINSVFYMRDKGTLVWGHKTLYNKDTSAISRISGRRVLTRIEQDILGYLVDVNGENSNPDLWNEITMSVDGGYLSQKYDIGWMYGYVFQCDGDNNPPEAIDNFELFLDLGIQLYKSAEYITLRVKIFKNSVSIEEQM